MLKNPKVGKLRADIETMTHEMGLTIGWRGHFAKVLQVHPSSINNALNGFRSGPKEAQIINDLHKYLLGLYKYYLQRATVNTKAH
jgi:hypothetical protein